jgi:hypothetical protein
MIGAWLIEDRAVPKSGGAVVSKFEATKDTAQVLTESAASHVGRIAMIITGAVREIAHELGEWATDAFEMRDASTKATAADD